MYRQFALHARNHSVSEAMSGNRLLVRPFVCGNLCSCCDPCCCKSPLDASEYYTTEERRLAALVETEKLKVIKYKLLSFICVSLILSFFQGYKATCRCRLCDFY